MKTLGDLRKEIYNIFKENGIEVQGDKELHKRVKGIFTEYEKVTRSVPLKVEFYTKKEEKVSDWQTYPKTK